MSSGNEKTISDKLQGLEKKLQSLQTKLINRYPDLPEDIKDELEFCEKAIYYLRVQVFESDKPAEDDPFRSRYKAMELTDG